MKQAPAVAEQSSKHTYTPHITGVSITPRVHEHFINTPKQVKMQIAASVRRLKLIKFYNFTAKKNLAKEYSNHISPNVVRK